MYRDTLKRLAKVVLTALVFDRGSRVQLLRHASQQVLGQVHQVMIIRIGLIEFQHGEFRIMPGRQPLVTKITINLVDLFITTDNQSFQIQFRCDTQKQVHVQRIVEGSERPCSGTTRNGLHHRCFDFQIAKPVQVLTNVLHNAAAHAKGVSRHIVHDEIDIALPVAGFLVGQTVKLFRQGPQRLRQHANRLGAHRQFTGFRPEQRTLGANDVAHVPALEGLVHTLGQCIPLQEQLDTAGHVL